VRPAPSGPRTDRLADFAALYAFEQLPAAAVAAAKVIYLDTIGAMLLGAGPQYGASRLTGDLARDLGGAPDCTVVGRGFKTNVANAALANGTLGYAADFEGGVIARQHAAAVYVPVALSVGEREHADGRALIAALALGYDVGGRIDRAADPGSPYPHSFHPSAVFGHFGAAATAGHLLGLDQPRFVNALGLAGVNAGGLIAWVNDPTEDSRPYVIGMAAHCGTMAAYLARAGMGGPLGIADDAKYSIYDAFSGAMHPDEVTRGLGEDFLIAQHRGFKRYACCGDIHSGIDALLAVVRANDLRPAEVAEVVHKVHPSRANVIDNNPLKSHCAQYIMAVAAVKREIPLDAILHDYRESDPDVRALSQRVRLLGHAEVEPVGAAVVEVRTRDGRSFRQESRRWRGGAEDPMTPQDLHDKFRRLATTRIPRESAERAIGLIDDLEHLDDAGRLMALLAAPESSS
jgi:2-methylcitrate dehydratase PrpD